MEQLLCLIAFTVTGIVIGVLFDVFRILRRSFKTADWLTTLQDILFWILAGFITLFSIFKFNNGEIRSYIFIGIALGANVIIANAVGQKDEDAIHKAVHTSILVAVIGGVFVAILLYNFEAAIFRSIGETKVPLMAPCCFRCTECSVKSVFCNCIQNDGKRSSNSDGDCKCCKFSNFMLQIDEIG